MTTDEIYDLYEKLEAITASLNELVKEYPNDLYLCAARQAEELGDTVFKCIGLKAAIEILKRRNNQ